MNDRGAQQKPSASRGRVPGLGSQDPNIPTLDDLPHGNTISLKRLKIEMDLQGGDDGRLDNTDFAWLASLAAGSELPQRDALADPAAKNAAVPATRERGARPMKTADVQRLSRLDNEIDDYPPLPLGITPREPAPAPSRGLMSAIFPYVAVAGFFAFVATSAVLYFVMAGRSKIEKRLETEPSGYASGERNAEKSLASVIAPGPDGYAVRQIDPPSGGKNPGAPGSQENVAFDPSPAEKRNQAGSDQAGSAQGNSVSAALTPPELPKAKPPLAAVSAEPEAQKPLEKAPEPESPKTASLEIPAKPIISGVRPDGQLEETPLEKPSAKPALVPPKLLISPEQEAALLSRAKETLKAGDVAAARLLLQYLSEQGSAAGAFFMGQSYDPAVLSSLGVRGLKGDTGIAQTWYEKAGKMGSQEAIGKIKPGLR